MPQLKKKKREITGDRSNQSPERSKEIVSTAIEPG